MNLDCQPLSSPRHIEDALGVIEVRALFEGDCFVGDVEWDEDQLLENYLEMLDDEALRADFEIERAAGIQAAKDHVIAELKELIVVRHGPIARQSPFEWDFGSELLLKRKSAICPTGHAYVWLSLFWSLTSQNQYLVATPDHSTFFQSFDKVFEAACAFVLAGRRESAAWYLGSSRNARDLLGRLREVTEFCGSGLVKSYQELTRTQKRSNDGGVDVLAVTTVGGAVTSDSEIYLVGATIQKKARRPKIIGTNQITRFRGYFMQQPSPPMIGVLAVPFPYSYLDAEECAEQNCLYLSKESLLLHLGRPLADAFARHLRPAACRIMAESRVFRQSVTYRN